MRASAPPEGFKIILAPAVEDMVRDVLESFPEDEWRWEAVLARLRVVGHKVGKPFDTYGTQRSDSFELDQWRVTLAWTVTHDTIRIVNAMF